MARSHAVAALVLALAAASAQAEVTLNYSASVTDANHAVLSQVGDPTLFIAGGVATPGMVTASFEQATASLQAWSTPDLGMFKSLTHVSVAGGNTLSAGAGVGFNLTDTLSFNGDPGTYVMTSFTVYWDTTVSGLSPQPANLGDGTPQPVQIVDSSRSIVLSYVVPTPRYVQLPGCPPGADFQIGNTEMLCPKPDLFVAQFGNQSVRDFTDWDGSILGDGNGSHTGQQTFEWAVPVGVPVRLSYAVTNAVICLDTTACELTSDASHSDYLRIGVADGGSFSSESGYQYLGKPLTPVPEPASWLLALIGLVPLVARARRRAA